MNFPFDFEVVEAKHAGGTSLWLRFRDGTEGHFDVRPDLRGPVFERLRDPDYFRRFKVDPELLTVCWPDGADISPVYLHEYVRAEAWAAEREGTALTR
jgi:hypothetical protein